MGFNAMTLHLNIVSAEKAIFSGLAEMVIATGELGEIGVMPGHVPLLTAIRPGLIRVFQQGGEEQVYYVSGGILEVQPQVVTVLADSCIRAEDLDEAEAVAAKERAQHALQDRQSDEEFSVVARDVAKAAAQIRAIQLLRKKIRH